MKIYLCIQARSKSSRFGQNKVFYQINNKPIFSYILNECFKIKYCQSCLLVPDGDLELFQEQLKKYNLYPILISGPNENNVLERFKILAEKYNPDIFVRLTADCICLSAETIENTINFFLNNNYDYVSNFTLNHSTMPTDARNYTSSSKLPEGFSVEVFNLSALEKTWQSVQKEMNEDLANYDKEHTTTWMKRNLNCGLYSNEYLIFNKQGKFSIDIPADVETARAFLLLKEKGYINVSKIN